MRLAACQPKTKFIEKQSVKFLVRFFKRIFFFLNYYYSAAAKYFVFLGETERERLPFSPQKESLPPSSSTFLSALEFCCAPGTFPVKSVIKMSDEGSDFVLFIIFFFKILR